MPLSLLVGPANAGKVARLLDRYLENLDREPFLVVPNRAEVDRVERDLLARRPALLGGTIGTFDDLFDLVARGEGRRPPVVTEAQRTLVVRRALAGASLNGLGPSARFAGFGDTLLSAISELESGLVDPDEAGGDLAPLYRAYRDELERLELSDRDLERRYAVERVEGELSAWAGRPVLAYGFEDLTGAQWALVQALAGRTDVSVSLPYEPGRPAFASLGRTAADLAGLADGRVEELPPAYAEIAHPALAHLERALFSEGERPDPPPLEGAVRFLEAAGSRGTLELVADEVLRLIRDGTAPEEIGIVCPAPDRLRAPLETALSTAGVPYAFEGRVRLGQIPFGHALLSALRFLWQGGGRRDLFGFLRSPYSGLPRAHADYLEGRLRGLGVRPTSRNGPCACADKRFHSSTTSVRRPLRSSRSACWRPACCAAPTASTPRPRTSPPGSTSAPTSRSCACCGSSRAGTTWPARSPARRCSRHSSACPFASPAPPSRAGWRSSTCFAPARAASRRCSC